MQVNTPATYTPEQNTVMRIAATATATAEALRRGYDELRRLTGYTPTGKNQFGLTTDAVWALIEAQKPAGMDAAEFAKLAQATKAMINIFVANRPIVDPVPVATITFPQQ